MIQRGEDDSNTNSELVSDLRSESRSSDPHPSLMLCSLSSRGYHCPAAPPCPSLFADNHPWETTREPPVFLVGGL